MSVGIAGITNVALCHQAIQRAFAREAHLPGMAVFYGPSGYGKSVAASFAANKFDAVYVECKSCWTRKAFLEAVQKAMGMKFGKNMSDMVDQIAEELAKSNRPLIIDEFDHLVERNWVEIVRDIYEASQGTILLIGEEQLPKKLQRWERFHGRILDFFPAQPVSLVDIEELKKIYAGNLVIEQALIEKLHATCKGSARRACVNLDRIREFAHQAGTGTVTVADWGDRDFFTGEAPRRRIA
ncbi:MAG: ATP-binding protein [Oceanospirillaceae bacterium]|nr:ATP-binding protein [Oceanospirillaceae bacterium]